MYKPIKKRYFIHRLVAIHFCEGYSEELVVNHIDGNKNNNKATNLEWVTRSENDKHAYKMKLRKSYPCQFKRRIIAYDAKTEELIITKATAKAHVHSILQKLCATSRTQATVMAMKEGLV